MKFVVQCMCMRVVKIEFDNKATDPVLLPFGVRTSATMDDLDRFFESRCFPRTRANCKQILESGSIPYYCPSIIVRKTEGRVSDDEFWIRFHN